jgi:hypothetical protein
LKFIGNKPIPIGEISYDYDAGADVGSGSITINAENNNGIYVLGPSEGKSPPSQDAIIKFLIRSKDHSEVIELKPIKD